MSMQVGMGQETVGGWNPKSCVATVKATPTNELVRTADLEPFGKVSDLQSSRLLELSEVDEELVGDASVRVVETKGVVTRETVRHVISIEKGNL